MFIVFCSVILRCWSKPKPLFPFSLKTNLDISLNLCCNVRKALSAVDQFQWKCHLCFCEAQRWQGVCWCDLGVWGWPADGGTQNSSIFLEYCFWENPSEKQTPSPVDLLQRFSFTRPGVHTWLPLLWQSKCLSRKLGIFPCGCWGAETWRALWSIFCRFVAGARKTCEARNCWTEQRIIEENYNLQR